MNDPDMVSTTQPRKAVLFVEVGSELGQERIVDEIRKRRPDVCLLGLVPRSAASRTTFDRVLTTFEESLLGCHEEYFRQGLFVAPEVFRELRKDYGLLLRLTERIVLFDLALVAKLPGSEAKFVGTFDDRIQWLNRVSAYWIHTFKTEKIRAVVMANYGHVGYDAVIQAVAKAMGIPCIFFNESPPFWGSTLMFEDVASIGDLSLGSELKTAVGPSDYEESRARHRKTVMLRQVVDAVGPHQSQPLGTVDRRQRVRLGTRSPRKVLAWLKKSEKKKWIRRFLRNLLLIQDMKRSVSTLNLPEHYVLYEFHSEPNGTIGIRCWMYADQRDAVAIVASSLPIGWKLVVKESSRQWTRRMPRARKYWSGIATIPNVHVVSHKMDMKELIPKASAVLALGNSSHALTGLNSGIPALVMGQTLLDQLHGVWKVESQSEVVGALKEIQELPHVDKKMFLSSAELLIEKCLRSSIEGSLTSLPSHVSPSERLEFAKNFNERLAQVVVSWLKRHEV